MIAPRFPPFRQQDGLRNQPFRRAVARLVVRTLVKDVSLSVRSGELFAIMGGSGSGKTTLLNVIAGRYQASQLQVRMGGAGHATSCP